MRLRRLPLMCAFSAGFRADIVRSISPRGRFHRARAGVVDEPLDLDVLAETLQTTLAGPRGPCAITPWACVTFGSDRRGLHLLRTARVGAERHAGRGGGTRVPRCGEGSGGVEGGARGVRSSGLGTPAGQADEFLQWPAVDADTLDRPRKGPPSRAPCWSQAKP
jgi:hypothetical protein